MNKRKPTIIEQKVTDNSAVLTLKVDADIVDFQGHFTSFPLLPGVTQIDWAVYYGKTLLNTPAKFAGMEVIKFQEPILPDGIVKLTLDWSAEKGKLHFSYSSANDGEPEGVTHSSGRIKLVTA
ncbi:3-hydroxyacyl-ACP dehydratase [uncultured Photobacterium sp.]|uniref:ApeI family dehydratase n=1 Tax=uncultured Photobacterium sp. TaxID=173973 RepID=UPI0026158315|nr:3-hydroxyacyl-ACP dehydratase [uncultured Photobacterium sp.]